MQKIVPCNKEVQIICRLFLSITIYCKETSKGKKGKIITHVLFAHHHNPLLITNHSWILAIHKDRIFLKTSIKTMVKNIQAAAYNGTHIYNIDLFPKWEVCWFNKYICLFLFLFTENRKNWKQHIHYLNFLILQLVVTLRICPTWPNSVGYGVPRDHYIVSFQKRTQCTAVVMKGNKKYHTKTCSGLFIVK